MPHDPLIVEQELAAASLLELPDDAPAVKAVEEMLARELGAGAAMTTYGTAVERLVDELGRHDYDDLVERSGAGSPEADRIAVRCLGRDYLISYPGGEVSTATGEPVDEHLAILLLLYLTEAGGRPLEGRWIAFEQISGGAGYSGSFRGRVVGPLLRTFGQRPEALLEAAARAGRLVTRHG